MSLQERELKDDNDSKAVTCPYCSSKPFRANGRLKSLQPCVCNRCKKNFSETTGGILVCNKEKR